MARTLAEIEAELRAQNPTYEYQDRVHQDGEVIITDRVYEPGSPEYEEWVAESAESLRQTELLADAATERAELRRKYRAGKTLLATIETDMNAALSSMAQVTSFAAVRQILTPICTDIRRLANIQDGVFEALKDAAIITDDEP